MTEFALIVCGIAILALLCLDAFGMGDEEAPPLWMAYVKGPYVRGKYTKYKGGF